MGKKAKLYLLIAINLAVWGYVGMKVYNALQGDESTDLSMYQGQVKKIDPVIKQDSVRLLLNYDDPFLKNGFFSSRKKKQISPAASKNPPDIHSVRPSQTVVPAIDIKYLGLIKNSTGGTPTALLSFNGKTIFVKQNEKVEGLLIKKISLDFILLIKGKEKIRIRK